ncbi:MAG: hypothetical protein RJA70_4919 [Pseudomonadota bacterium]|jgi:hypothetical protein
MPSKKDALTEYGAQARDDNDVVLSRDVLSSQGSFDSQLDGGTIFWRGERIGPTELNQYTKKSASKIGLYSENYWERRDPNLIFRFSEDDVVHASAVCIARDVRGAAFFPMGTESLTYVYAVSPQAATCTFTAQKIVDAVERGVSLPSINHSDWKTARAWKYDPMQEDHENMSCVWQFEEWALPHIPKKDIVGCWEVERKVLVSSQGGGEAQLSQAGIKFKFRTKNIWFGTKHEQFDAAAKVVDAFSKWYPSKPNAWLSYQGLIECEGKYVETLAHAAQYGKQKEQFVPTYNRRGAY